MNKKNILRIAAAVSAALLFGGAYVYFRNDIAQKETEHEPPSSSEVLMCISEMT